MEVLVGEELLEENYYGKVLEFVLEDGNKEPTEVGSFFWLVIASVPSCTIIN